MAVSKKIAHEQIRLHYLELVNRLLAECGEELLRVESNQLAIPCVDCNDEEQTCVITFKVPIGANKGTEPYDPYAEAESYALKVKAREEKAKANAEKKERKRLRDEEVRRKKAEIAKKGGQ